jgi:hypothetical protein
MKLSEAIRLGSMMRPQAFGWIFDLDGIATCAWGAGLEAAGIRIKAGQSNRYNTPVEWRGLVNKRVRCPAKHTKCDFCHWGELCVECANSQSLALTIEHLNDDHKWTRERIADFVEQIENQQQQSIPLSTEQEHVHG